MNGKTSVLTSFALLIVFVFVIVGIVMVLTPSAAEVEAERVEFVTEIALAGVEVCSDNEGYLRPALSNPLNTSTTEYLSVASRVYQVTDKGTATEKEVFYGTVTTQTSGVVARAATGSLAITCQDASGDVIDYVLYVPASDGVSTSARVEFTAAEDVVLEIDVPKQAGLLFRVKDNDAGDFTYESADATAGLWVATGSTFYNTSSNSTGPVPGINGAFDYTIGVKTNATAGTNTQFKDQALYLYVNLDDLSDWNEMDVSVGLTGLTSIDFPNSKVANEGYDHAYEIMNVAFTTSETKVNVKGMALTGATPTDDVVVAFGTSGYYKETVGSAMKMDTNKDDTSKTTVYTLQSITFNMD